MQELADSIKRLRSIDDVLESNTVGLMVRDAIRASNHPEAIQTINQLVELVAEMRESLDEWRHDRPWELLERFADKSRDKADSTLTKADALLSGLKE